MRRERDEVEDPVDVLVARLGQPLGGPAANEPLRARAGVDPRRLDPDDAANSGRAVAAAIPTSETISCVESLLTGVVRRTGQRAVIRASARSALWRPTMCWAMCSASASMCSASLPTTASIASSNSSGKRDMCTPFCSCERSTVHSISAAITVCVPSWLHTHGLLDAGDAGAGQRSRTSGVEAWRSGVTLEISVMRLR